MPPIDLEDFDEDFKPAEPANLRSKAEELPDADYEFEIVKSWILETGGNKTKEAHRIWKMELKVVTPGKYDGTVIDHAIFVDTKEQADRVGLVLVNMGFDANDWHGKKGDPNRRTFSTEWPKAVKLIDRLKPRLRMKGTKKTADKKDKDGKVLIAGAYHNIYLNKRSDTDGQPATFGEAELNAKDESDPFGD
jgi:hypothetical protein